MGHPLVARQHRNMSRNAGEVTKLLHSTPAIVDTNSRASIECQFEFITALECVHVDLIGLNP